MDICSLPNQVDSCNHSNSWQDYGGKKWSIFTFTSVSFCRMAFSIMNNKLVYFSSSFLLSLFTHYIPLDFIYLFIFSFHSLSFPSQPVPHIIKNILKSSIFFIHLILLEIIHYIWLTSVLNCKNSFVRLIIYFCIKHVRFRHYEVFLLSLGQVATPLNSNFLE